MHIISKKKLIEFWEQPPYRDAENPLKSWYSEVKKASWRTPSDVKAKFGNTSFIANNRVVFNIAGNKYRLVVEIYYNPGVVLIRFIGTHAEYDKVDVKTIK